MKVNVKQTKRLLALIMTIVMILGMLPMSAFAEGTDSITIEISMQEENEFPIVRQELDVVAGLAKDYGYEYGEDIEEDDITVLDALVAAHIMFLKTEEIAAINADLIVDKSGYITKVFNKVTYNFGFTVNGSQPNDGKIGSFGTYTGYTCNQALLSEGDIVEFFFYQDEYTLDSYSWFEDDAGKTEAITVSAGEDFSLTLKGYWIIWYGCSTEVVIEEKTTPIETADIGIVNIDTGKIERLPGVTTDDDGIFTHSFDEPGTYVLSAIGEEEYCYIISPWCVVTVTEAGQETDEDITVTLRFRADTVADDLDGLFDKMDEVLWGGAEAYTKLPDSDMTVTVPKGATVKDVIAKAQEVNGFYIEGLEEDFITTIGFIGNDTLSNLTDTSRGNLNNKNVFSNAGWMVYVDGVDPGAPISDTSVADGAVIEERYNLYGDWIKDEDGIWSARYYDQEFIDNYNALKELTATVVDTSGFSEEAITAYNNAQTEAEDLLTSIYNAATLKTPYAEKFGTEGGMWLGYIEEQYEDRGIDSSTVQLEDAAVKLQKGINNELLEAVTYSLSGITLTSGSTMDGTKNAQALPAEETLSPSVNIGEIADTYTYYVNYTRDTIKIKPTAVSTAAIKEMTVSGATVTVGSASDTIDLAVGNNFIPIVIEKEDGSKEIYNILVRRKPVLLNDFTIEGGEIRRANGWTYTVNFSNKPDTIKFTPEIPEDAILTIAGIEGSYGKGDTIDIPVTGSTMNKSLIVSVTKEFEEDDLTWSDNQVYAVGIYWIGSDSPTSIASYLPAPGQFVNQTLYSDPDKTLEVSDSIVTLGSYGGSVTYYFKDAITNDPNNPYGIDFIVYGNAYKNPNGTSASSSSEPGAVMVSDDGDTWYELAGSRYYDDSTRHNVTITYTNTDTTFEGAVNIPWSDGDGNSGYVTTNKKAYYPNPEIYDAYNSGITGNANYDGNSVSLFGGSLFKQKLSPAYGYGDTHASSDPISNVAANPYVQDHYATFNGDGMDLAWAVDQNGKPVDVDGLAVHYVKIYNPMMYDSGSTGEISPEIAGVYRASPGSSAVGKSGDLTGLDINGKSITIADGTYEYDFDAEGSTTIKVTPTATDNSANILVNDNWLASGATSDDILTGGKLRIIVQSGNHEPQIYTITLVNSGDTTTNAELESLVVLPGDISAEAIGNDVFTAMISNASNGFLVRAVPLNKEASVTINDEPVDEKSDWQSQSMIAVDAGKSESITITVTPQNGDKKDYTLKVTREANSTTTEDNTINVSFSLIGDSKHGENTAHNKFETWLEKKSYTVPKGSTVKYLTDMVLINEGISFTVRDGGTYISSVRGLSELDNGPDSGWMFKVNNKHPENTYANLILNANDAIVLHYTDDFTKEEGSEKWGGSAALTESTTSSAVTVAINPVATVKNGEATAAVTDKEIADVIIAANKEKATVVTVTPIASGDFSKVSITMPVSGVSDIYSKTAAQLSFSTTFGAYVVPREALAVLAKTNGKTLAFSITKNANQSVTVMLLVDGKSVELGNTKLILPVGDNAGKSNGENSDSAYVAVFIGTDQSSAIIKKSAIIDGEMHMLLSETGTVKIIDNGKTFSDVETKFWGADNISFVTSHEIFNGMSNDAFAPTSSMNRAMMALVFYNLENEPNVDRTNQFSDVARTDWFFDAVNWASDSGLTTGTDKGFAPSASITREQLATMLYRYAQMLNVDTSQNGTLKNFNDAGKVSDWAEEAMTWAVGEKFINGKGNQTLDPSGLATRAEVAAIMQRFVTDILQ